MTTPCTKRKYLTLASAEMFLRWTDEMQGKSDRLRLQRHRGRMEVYVCRSCTFYHVGHPPAWKAVKRA